MTEFGLPRHLGDGLLLRWATRDDAEELAAFNMAMHSDDPDDPEEWLAGWTKDLMGGQHPTTDASDFTVVVDTNTGKIVSTLGTISQRWTYDGIEFGVGRPELVATHPDYRRRGLVRVQMEAVHAKSKARGELVQVITGIPWYYRLFGYEMGLDLGGGRVLPLPIEPVKKKKEEKEEETAVYTIRPATLDDIPLLKPLYARHCQDSRIASVRTDAIWAYEMEVAHADSFNRRYHYLISPAKTQDVVGYVSFRQFKQNMNLYEIAVKPGHSLRAVGLFVLEHLKQEAWRINNGADSDKIARIVFRLGADHSFYRALAREVRQEYPPYAFYVRVVDLPAFLRRIAPALEKRLADSVMAGHSGTLRLNFFTDHHTLVFENGRFQEVGTYKPKSVEDGDAHFPDLTFLQLLFGYRSLDDLFNARADCYYNNEAAVLLDILFPPQPSCVAVIS